MKKIALGLSILGLAGYVGVATAASPACSALAISTISTTPQTLTGNTCTNNTGVASVCTGLTSLNGAGADIYGLTIGASYNNVTLTVTPTGTWDPGIYVMPSSTNACGGTGQPCRLSVQATSAVAVMGTLPTGLTAGTYYIVVGDAGSDPTGCGIYGLAVTGTLPVTLQNFSVQ